MARSYNVRRVWVKGHRTLVSIHIPSPLPLKVGFGFEVPVGLSL